MARTASAATPPGRIAAVGDAPWLDRYERRVDGTQPLGGAERGVDGDGARVALRPQHLDERPRSAGVAEPRSAPRPEALVRRGEGTAGARSRAVAPGQRPEPAREQLNRSGLPTAFEIAGVRRAQVASSRDLFLTATAGRNSPTSRTASTPFTATPTTSMSGSRASNARVPSRTTG